jgi:UDP-N-acetyl-2-amino-2-deoxyglucuronate dehydrogenase
MSNLKAAVIGTGGAARLHMQAYAAGGHTRPVAVVSRDTGRAGAFAAEFGVRGYTSITEMLQREQPDVVSVATLEWDHEAPVVESLAAGCHVLCEKILAHEIAIGERMVAAAQQAGRTLGVNYNYRSVPSHRLIRQELERGGFGAMGTFSAEMHAYLWPHLLDLLRYFFGDPVEVRATMVDDQALRPPVSAASGRAWRFGVAFPAEMLYHPSIAVSASLRFREPEFVATMASSALVPLEQNFWSFALYGTGDALHIDRATRANLHGTASLGKIAAEIAEMPPCSYEESFGLSVADFVDALLDGRPAPVTGQDGLAALRLDAAIVESAQTGRTIPFSAEPKPQ